MKAGTKFALGAALIVASVGYLMASGIKQTGQYFLTPSELAQRVSADPSFYDLGMKVGARVVPGTVEKETATQTLRFHMTDGTVSYPVVFRGCPPIRLPTPSKSSSKGACSAMACFTRPTSSPSAGRVTKPFPRPK
jgi:cytochrome c-type biogenesis protein CcmE